MSNSLAPKLLAEFISALRSCSSALARPHWLATAPVWMASLMPSLTADHHGLRVCLRQHFGRSHEPSGHRRCARRRRHARPRRTRLLVSQLIGGIAAALLVRAVLAGTMSISRRIIESHGGSFAGELQHRTRRDLSVQSAHHTLKDELDGAWAVSRWNSRVKVVGSSWCSMTPAA